MTPAARSTFWNRARRLTLLLLLAWLVLNLAVPWFARDLNHLELFGFPLGYWLASEGMLLLYLAIIVAYVVVMDRLEARALADDAELGDGKP
jgi:putative solute:sodium symporter small subunit